MRVCYLGLTTRLGPTTRYRALQYQSALRASGIDLDVFHLFDDLYLEAERHRGRRRITLRALASARAGARRIHQLLRIHHRRAWDLVVLERELFPYLPGELETAVLPRPYALELDDAMFHVPGRTRKYPLLFTRAVGIIVGNEYLAAHARRFCHDVEIIPTTIDPSPYPERPAKRAPGPLRLGWIGLPANFVHLTPALDALRDALLAGDLELWICSARPPSLALPIHFVPWSESHEAQFFTRIDVGIMPLQDTAFARGKCGLKLLQYMAASLPCIASPVGVNRDILAGLGYLAANAEQWRHAAGELESADIRVRLGKKGRQRVISDYSVKRWAPSLAATYRRLAARRQSAR